MNQLESFKLFGRSLALAAMATLFVLIVLEWIMPGSVLPFVNLVVFAPVLTFASVLLLLSANWGSGAQNWLEIGMGFAFGALILAFSGSVVGYSSLSQIGLLGSILLILGAWSYIQIQQDFHK